MTLIGTLEDMNIMELIQFPGRGRKSGELHLSYAQKKAILVYNNGFLIHAEIGDNKGFDALITILDWEEGEFEFQPKKEIRAKGTINGELIHVVMQALKLRDERKEEESFLKRKDQFITL